MPSPDTSSNARSTARKAHTCFQLLSPTIKVSSANWRISTEQEPFMLNFWNSPTSMDFFTSLVRPSVTNTKRKGERGSPCLSPLLTSNSLVGQPLTSTDILLLNTSNSIHFIHLFPKPILFSINLKKIQLNLSYAFSKSTLNKMHSFPSFLA